MSIIEDRNERDEVSSRPTLSSDSLPPDSLHTTDPRYIIESPDEGDRPERKTNPIAVGRRHLLMTGLHQGMDAHDVAYATQPPRAPKPGTAMTISEGMPSPILAAASVASMPRGVAMSVALSNLPVDVEIAGVTYRLTEIDWSDTSRLHAYQQLRRAVFIDKLGWSLSPDAHGGETDRYDIGGGRAIRVYGVFGVLPDGEEVILGGVRIFFLRTWAESMLANEFSEAGVVPKDVMSRTVAALRANDYLELTRLCVRPGRRYVASGERGGDASVAFDLAIARDLVYGAVYAAAEVSWRRQAIALVDRVLVRMLARSRFAITTVYDNTTPGLTGRASVALVTIDLGATITSLRLAGNSGQAERLLVACAPYSPLRGDAR